MEEKKEEHHSHHEHHKKSISKKINLGNVFIGLTLLLGVILLINLYSAFSLNKELKNTAEALQEKLKPAEVELSIIKNSKCPDCADISQIVSYVKSLNTNVTKETTLEFDSKQAKELIGKYKIDKIPTLIITGEIGKISIDGFDKNDNALMLSKVNPPYTNSASGKIEGMVVVYNLKDTSCKKCKNLSAFSRDIRNAGIKIAEEKDIDISSSEGKQLVQKYKIGFVPAVIMSKDAALYDIMEKAWPQVGSKESDGAYVMRVVNPPYINLTTNKLRGIVSMIYLGDKSCSECYDVNLHREILASPQSFAMAIDKEENFDISDEKGKDLVERYNITQVPTVILSGETAAYPSNVALRQFFSVEKDGSFIFRKLAAMGAYKDLTANSVVKPVQQGQEVPA